MKEQDPSPSPSPFNPAVPAEFKLLNEGAAIEQGQSPPGITTEFTAGAEKTKRKSSRSGKQATGPRARKKSKMSWQNMKEKINAKLGGLDKAKLKAALTACGLAAGIVAAVVIAAKLIPVAILLLALVGVATVIAIWDRLRRRPGYE